MKRLRVEISHDRYRLFSVVQLFEGDRLLLWTTMHPGVKRGDPQVKALIRRYYHDPKVAA